MPSRIDPDRIPRRTFLGGVAAALAACTKSTPAEAKRGTNEMPRRRLGRTGEMVSIVSLGGYHIGNASSEAEAVRIIRSAIDRGVSFLDNCWDYHGGRSEEWMGKALEDGWRNEVVLMTKLDGRTKQAAAAQLEQSLRRLRVDTIDVVQIHEVIRPSDPERAFAEGGCVEALLEARRAGKLRYIGFTGHKDPSIHLAMLKAADEHGLVFDTVQLPLNVMDAHFRSFERQVLPVLLEKDIGVLAMKPLGSGKILETGRVSAIECLRYAMNLPVSTVITGFETMELLDQAIDAALGFEPMSKEQVVRLLARTKEYAMTGRYERFKTSADHDGTVVHPEWLESA